MASIRQTSRGAWECVWRTPDHGRKCSTACTKTSHQHTEAFPVKWQAERKQAEMEAWERADRKLNRKLNRKAAPVAAPQTSPDFRSAAIDLINRGGPRKAWNARTQAMYRSILSTQLGALYDRSVADVADDRDMAEKIADTATRPGHALSLMRAVCQHAVNSGTIASHRLADIVTRPTTERRDIIPFTEGQLASIAAELDAWQAGTGLAAYLAAGCGLRVAEVLAVEARDFREDFRTLRVSRQVQDGQACPLKSKAANAYRDVPVPVSVAQKVREHVSGRKDSRLFTSRGGYVSYGELHYRFTRSAVTAGLPARFTPHQLRHGFATKLLTAGVPITDVAGFMGHSSTAMTETYSHLLPSSFDRARAVLDKAA